MNGSCQVTTGKMVRLVDLPSLLKLTPVFGLALALPRKIGLYNISAQLKYACFLGYVNDVSDRNPTLMVIAVCTG